MAAPVDSARQGTNVTTASATWNVNVGSPSAGTLLIVAARFAAAPGAVTFAGYTPFAGPDASDDSDDTTTLFYRWADGAEGATDVLDPTNSVKGATICWEITGARNPASGQVPVASTVAVGTTTANTANPDVATLPLGSQEALFLAFAGGDGEVGAYTGTPTNYGNLVVANSGTGAAAATNCFIGGASRQLTAESDDPGAFTHGAHTNGWTAYTIAIYPAVVVQRSAVAFPVTFTPTVSGTATTPPQTRYGQVVSPFTFGVTSSSQRYALGAVAEAFTFDALTNGTRIGTGQGALPVTWDAVTNGTRVGLGQVALPLTWDAVTAGAVSAGESYFGTAVVPLTWDAVTSGYLAQLAHPTADSVDGAWTNELGGADLEGSIDDLTVSDADYIQSELNPQTSATRIKLEGLSDPATSSGHVLRWRIAKDAAGGSTVSLTATLRQGGGDVLGAGTEIATFTRSDVTETFTTFEEHLSGAQADAITDYSALYLELSGDVA